MDTQNTVAELIRKQESDYLSGTTTIGKYVEFSQYENIEQIDAYLNSKHVSGDFDSQGREKPFFNIVTAVVNIWYRATTIASTMIRIKSNKFKKYIPAFIATLLIHDWMRKNNFDDFLNKWDLTEARYGSAVVEFVEHDVDLIPSVLPWNRLITDTVDFENNPKIKILWLTPAQLRKNKLYDQDKVKELLEARSARETTGRQKKDSKSEYIKVYELHGELELSQLTDKESDNEEFVQQMHVVSFVSKRGKRGEYDDFTLYKGKEKNPHMITHLIEEDGRAQSVGAVEHLFEAQWMVNHSTKQIKDRLDLASKLIYQTADPNLVGQNVLTAMENGDIIVHAANAPLTELNKENADITALQNFALQWQVLAKEITSTPDAISGNTQPSGTPFRSVAVENQEAHSLFEVMKRNKKRDLEEMMRRFVIPFIKKQMDTTDEIASILRSQDISTLDQIYVPDEARKRDNQQLKKTILSGELAQNLDPNQLQAQIQGEMATLGNQRFIKPSEIASKTWKDVLDGFEWECDVEIENKASDDQLVAQTLVDILKISADPNVQMFLNTPKGKMIFNKILDKTNALSPLELAQMPVTQSVQAPPAQASPQPQSVGGSTVANNSGASPSGNNPGLSA